MTKEIFIANLDYDITEEDLKESFAHYGEIEWIELFPSKGLAYLRYVKEEDAILAIRSIEGIDFLGRQLRLGWVEDNGPRKIAS